MISSRCVVATDATLVYDALRPVIAEALGALDPAFALQDFTARDGASGESPLISQILEALHTPPFLVDRRVVVVREAQHLSADDSDQLVAWMKAPTPDTVLCLGVVGPKTNKLVKAAEEVIAAGAGTEKGAKPAYVRDTLAHYNVQLDAAGQALILEHFGDELERVDGLARTLQNIYGSAPLSVKHITPYLGDIGNVPEWDLTDAIDRGDASAAINVARRMLDSRGRAGLQIVNILSRFYLRAARLEGLDLDGEGAAAIVGGHKFTAQKSAAFARKLGAERLGDAVALLTQADLDLKGAVSYGGKDLESDQDVTELTVIEVLVARLARLSAARRR